MYTYLGKWIMVNNSKCESLSSLPTRGGSIPLQVTNSGSLLGAFPGLLLGAPKRALWHGLHSALASPGPCPAEIMYRLLGLRPVLGGPRPLNPALWLPQDSHGLRAVPAQGATGFCTEHLSRGRQGVAS